MNFISNIDTICVLVDTENYEQEAEQILKYLEKEKENAKLYSLENASYKHLIKINNMSFTLSANGKKGYAYLLQNSGFQVDIAQYKSKLKNFLPIQIRISSEYLWAYGLSHSWSIIYNWIVEAFGNIINEKVFRLDLCCHISDIDFVKDCEISYKGDFKKRQVFHTGNNINALTFGSRKSKNIYCRIYNKSLEIQNTYNNFSSCGLIEKQKQIDADAKILIPNIVGSIISYSARKNTVNIDNAFSGLYRDAKKYLSNKNTSFETEVNNKLAFLHDCEVKQNE